LPLTNDRAIKLTTSLYYTPNGRSIQARGIIPDIAIDRGQVTKIPQSLAAYREADLTGHLETDPGEEGAATPSTALTPDQVLVEDYQLNEALNVLKGLNILKAQAQN
jgi:carboxyl-terminal processing protease